MLHAAFRDRVADLAGEFAGSRPFRHVVIDQFLDPAFCQRLIDGFPVFDESHARNELGAIGRKAVVPNLASLGSAYQCFDRLMSDGEFLSLVGQITGIAGLLYDPEYVGGGTHENLDGQELDSHVDFNYHPATKLHRRLNLIVFLNPEWEESWGGSLELLRDPFNPDEERVTVVPLANRAVIFETTESSWHGFRRIRLPAGEQISRRSIAVYYYTRERPPRETAPPHATVYYQRPLPAHLQPGHTLTEDAVQEIQALLTRRDHMLRLLYERELQFSEAIAKQEARIQSLEELSQMTAERLAEELAAAHREIQALRSREQELTSLLARIHRSPSVRLGKALTWPVRALRSLVRTEPGPTGFPRSGQPPVRRSGTAR